MTTPISDKWKAAGVGYKFRNRFLSVSRLKQFEACPSSFARKYIISDMRKKEILPPESDAEKGLKLLDQMNGATDFGTFVHAVIEKYLLWVQAEEYSGRVRIEKLKHFLKEELASGEHNVSGQQLYNDAVEALKLYCRNYPTVDHMDIIGIEMEFRFIIGEGDDRFEVMGYMDQVMRTGPNSIKIIDHKSNRMLFEDDYLVHDLQMSTYYVAARKLFPWATTVELEFNMLRHGELQRAERHDGQIEEICEYLIALGKQTENGEEYPERLNENCSYCEFRHSCQTFKYAVAAELPIVQLEKKNIEGKLLRWEQIANRVKPLYAEKKDLEKELVPVILERGGAIEVQVPGDFPATFRVKKGWPKKVHKAATVRTILKSHGVPGSEILKVMSVDNDQLRNLYKRLEKTMPSTELMLLKQEIDASAEVVAKPGIYRE